VVGLDGGVGYPAYSGLLPNPMLASALATTRESSLAGGAAWPLYESGYVSNGPPFLDARHVDWGPKRQVQSLQSNVRGVLVEMELLRSIEMFHSTANAGLRMAGGGPALITIGRLPEPVFDCQLQLVQSYSALRAERTSEILAQVVPQAAHWSSIAALSPERHRFTWELIGFGLRFAMMMVMQLKFQFNVRRPWERSAVVQPMLLTPGYAAYPSGHATEASFVAELLPLLAADPTHPCADPAPSPDRKDGMARQLNRLAFRVAENRVVAGLHYPVDSMAGLALGPMLARYLVWLTGDSLPGIKAGHPKVGSVVFPDPGPKAVDGTTAEPDFDCFVDEAMAPYALPPETELPKSPSPPPAPVLRDLWALARREWCRE
jgi:hypothetical protein